MGAGQVSWEPGEESGLLLLSHLLLIFPHQDALLGAEGQTSLRHNVSLPLVQIRPTPIFSSEFISGAYLAFCLLQY